MTYIFISYNIHFKQTLRQKNAAKLKNLLVNDTWTVSVVLTITWDTENELCSYHLRSLCKILTSHQLTPYLKKIMKDKAQIRLPKRTGLSITHIWYFSVVTVLKLMHGLYVCLLESFEMGQGGKTNFGKQMSRLLCLFKG